MTLLAPWALLAGLAAAAVVTLLHLLAWRRPPEAPLPTARFVPASTARARSRTLRPTDVALLALRVAALLLAALGVARPVREGPRGPLARIVVADAGASVAGMRDVRDSARAQLRAGDVLLAFDTTAHVVAGADSLVATPAAVPGRLSTALVAAGDAARALGATVDSAELVLVTPMAREEVDAATPALLRDWGGRVRLVRVPAGTVSAPLAATTTVEHAEGDDPVAAAVRLALAGPWGATTRIVRAAAMGVDSAWQGAQPGRVLVLWPARSGAPRVAGLAWDLDESLVAPLVAGDTVPAGRALARWGDGRVAIGERPLGQGCVRAVSFDLPRAGDVALSPGVLRLVRALVAPCGPPRDLGPWEPGTLLRVAGPARPLARPAPADPWRIGRWLLAGAIALLLLELLVRRARIAVDDAGDRPADAGRVLA